MITSDILHEINRGASHDTSYKVINTEILDLLLRVTKVRVDLELRYFFKNFQEIINLNEVVNLERSKCLLVKIKDKNMEICMDIQENNYGIPLDVSIGQIEVSLQDIIDMKQGECIIGKLPTSNFVTLMIAGEPIANATFEVEGEMVVLKINNLYVNESSQSRDNELGEIVSS